MKWACLESQIWDGSSMKEMKAKVIHEALSIHDGNKEHTARALKMSIRCLRNWVQTHDSLAQWRNQPRRHDAKDL